MEELTVEPSSSVDQERLALLAGWLDALPGDIEALTALLRDPSAPQAARGFAAGAASIVLDGAELSFEGIEHLCWLEVALLVRLLARAAEQRSPGSVAGALAHLGQGMGPILDWLGDMVPALEHYADERAAREVRGRSAAQLLESQELAAAAAEDLAAAREGYVVPPLARNEYTLIKLHRFFSVRVSTRSDD